MEKMEGIGVKELRDNLSRILKRVEKGEAIKILRHGHIIAELKPSVTSKEQGLIMRLKDQNMISGGPGKIGALKTVKNLKPDMPVSDFVIEDRR